MALGTYANTLFLNPTSGTSNLGAIQLHLEGEIALVPEPSTWLLLVGGSLGFLVLQRYCRRARARAGQVSTR